MPLPPSSVIPPALGRVLDDLPHWFVIGGHAVRCFAPYRPSRDVDFGVGKARDLDELLKQLDRTGALEVLERDVGTIHLRWNGLRASIFVLDRLVPFVEERRLTVTGILATKLHAILDRGLRRDFFDLYVMLEQQRLGIAACLTAVREVYRYEDRRQSAFACSDLFRRRRSRSEIAGRGTGRLEKRQTVLP